LFFESVEPENADVPIEEMLAKLPEGNYTIAGRTITGEPATIIAYQLIVEKDVEPHRHMIGKLGLSMYLPRAVTSIAVPDRFLQPHTAYKWEVLAIERSGNQTLSSGSFRTR